MPKSANRSGKSTPTRGRTAEKKEDEQVDVESARLKAEEEERKRVQQEVLRKLEQERLQALELIRETESTETCRELEVIRSSIQQITGHKKSNAQWDRYMRCDGKPDPTSTKEINTFVTLAKENGKPNAKEVLSDIELILTLIDELNLVIADSDLKDGLVLGYQQAILSLQELIMARYNDATLEMLKNASAEADSETGNLQKVVRGEQEMMMIWGNLNKNPRFKGFEFENEQFLFELPKVLAMSDISVRIVKTKFDHYSHQCRTYLASSTNKDEVVEEKEDEIVVEDNQEKKGGEQEDGAEDKEEIGSEVEEDRKIAISRSSEKNEDEDAEKVTNAENRSLPEELPETPDIKSEAPEDLDEVLDPDVMDLRQYSPLGGIYHFDLLKLPPQPKVVRGWTLTQIVDGPLSPVNYPSDTSLGKSTSKVDSATIEPKDVAEGNSPSKTPLDQQPPIGVTLGLPSNVSFFEEPQVARWDSVDKHWKTSGINDLDYDEERRRLSFKTNEFGIFCLMQDLHLNMPFQSWEICPMGKDRAKLTVTAAIAELQIEIKGGCCKLVKPEEDASNELSEIYEKWFLPEQLIVELRTAGVNIFPASDSSKFVSIQQKEIDVDLVYQQMALLSSAFAFSWSKWNTQAERVAFRVAPLYVTDDCRPVPDDDWSVYLSLKDRCYKLALNEFDDDPFIDLLASGASYHYDIMNAVRMTSLKGDPDGKLLKSLNERSRNVDKFFADAVHTLLSATQVVTFS